MKPLRIAGIDLGSAAGDGATLSAPARPRLRIFRCVSILFHQPGGDRVAEVTLCVMTRRRWERHWARAKPFMRAVDVGPLVVAVGFTL